MSVVITFALLTGANAGPSGLSGPDSLNLGLIIPGPLVFLVVEIATILLACKFVKRTDLLARGLATAAGVASFGLLYAQVVMLVAVSIGTLGLTLLLSPFALPIILLTMTPFGISLTAMWACGVAWSVAADVAFRRERRYSKAASITHGVLQFIPVVGLIDLIVMLAMGRAGKKNPVYR